jgi:nitrile hydratase
MNGVHDVGGMHGFGRVQREENEPVFHAAWERSVFAITMVRQECGKKAPDHLGRALAPSAP